MDHATGTIAVLAIGEVSDFTCRVVAAHLSGYLNLRADVGPRLEHPAYAFSETRLQYDAGAIIRRLETGPHDAYAKVLGMLDLDLFVPIFTHVFGEARQAGRCAVVSSYRLARQPAENPPPGELVLERVSKVALHEVGHLFNLHHCDDANCLMHFAGSLQELDRTPPYLCRYCSAFLKEARTAR